MQKWHGLLMALAGIGVSLLIGCTQLQDLTLSKEPQPEDKVRYDSFPDGGGILAQYALFGTKWNKSTITYYFESGTTDISGSLEQQAFYDAFDLWQAVDGLGLTFTETHDPNAADIVILFGRGDHGDPFPFDGIGGVLAHAYFPPPNGGSLAGDAHFDDDEIWTLDFRSSHISPRDLVTVAAHEIGHSLGLQHSQDSGALMYPYYLGSHRYLGGDDIDGILAIYGEPTTDLVLSDETVQVSTTYRALNTITGHNINVVSPINLRFIAGVGIDIAANFTMVPGGSIDFQIE